MTKKTKKQTKKKAPNIQIERVTTSSALAGRVQDHQARVDGQTIHVQELLNKAIHTLKGATTDLGNGNYRFVSQMTRMALMTIIGALEKNEWLLLHGKDRSRSGNQG